MSSPPFVTWEYEPTGQGLPIDDTPGAPGEPILSVPGIPEDGVNAEADGEGFGIKGVLDQGWEFSVRKPLTSGHGAGAGSARGATSIPAQAAWAATGAGLVIAA